jgi:hypothetical protein
MSRMLLFMHNNVLCTLCIALFNCDHLFAYTIDPAEPKSKIHIEQVQRSVVVHKLQVRGY